ncbi:hypothetical protein HS048_01045 [Planomonospora sp. ID91781]|uniref:Antibiotic biosynthesis monooxygenase n=1 Tax=Planomonospora sphaerica TaxID=161355 RepID=A0A161LMC3_9ACTN|nr:MULTISPECIES: hypothetical protein [Planomonospora]MBG0819350.1 hypothetical protein [Planomonospora sp. ID91781]GAT70237.1 hypothetical protein PS9374_05917 [Planomonospora sphaerica]
MSVVRSHTYSVDPADLEEFLARRASLIGTVRETHPGLTAALLVELEDGTYSDTWHWESDAQMGAALAAISTFPEAPLTMALTRDAAALNGRVVDER